MDSDLRKYMTNSKTHYKYQKINNWKENLIMKGISSTRTTLLIKFKNC